MLLDWRKVRRPVLEVGHKNSHALHFDFKEKQFSWTKVLPNYKQQQQLLLLLSTGLDINLFWIRPAAGAA